MPAFRSKLVHRISRLGHKVAPLGAGLRKCLSSFGVHFIGMVISASLTTAADIKRPNMPVMRLYTENYVSGILNSHVTKSDIPVFSNPSALLHEYRSFSFFPFGHGYCNILRGETH